MIIHQSDLGRILAIDFGTKRIGVALSDETKTIAIPKPYILNSEKEKLVELARQADLEAILIGLPVGLSGQETASSKKVRKFSAWLGEETHLPMHLIDERFTSKEALRFEKDRELVDSLVAQKMLERYLERIRS